MSDTAIQKQIEAIQNATRLATQTREAAIQFLIDAGIMPAPVLTVSCEPKKEEKEKSN